MDFVKNEEKILKFWKQNRIFEKSLKQRKKCPSFVFYEGPPTANAKAGLHHLLARVFKDIICRYKTMAGFYVKRKAGWDTHGLPVEIEIEKKIGSKSKKDIEKFGLAKFNQKCRESVWQYKTDWEDLTERIGYWLDIKEPYITYETNYIETVWWLLKQIWQKGLLYQDYKVVAYCPRCGTSLSSHEVAQGYKKIKEPAIFVKFKLKTNNYKLQTNLLVWTTTPWTLPGNVAIAINPKFTYAKVKKGDEYLILAKNRIKECGIEGKIVQEIKGKDLIGLEYQPLYQRTENTYKVIGANFVSLEEGTGLVHIAPAFGEDDMNVAKRQFPILITVDEQGKMLTPGYRWDKMFVKKADPLIIADLKKRKLLFKEELYEHDYPFCWRCRTPLIYYAKKSWFIEMTKVKRDLIKNNGKINWIPAHLKQGRFGEWLKELKDWTISRERYWGTPLPIWQCEKCRCLKVIGSIKELEKLSGKKIKDLHKPFIDKITFRCEKCNGLMRRVPEVIDCWFDSGSMPFAQYHYPFENKDLIDSQKQFPADCICEGIDQTRGWFYTLLAISTLLGFGPSYRNVISVGHILDDKGEKMSKSKGNVVDPWDIIEKYGSDAVRWYFYTVNQPGDSKFFREKDIQQSLKKFIMTFWNCYAFFETYKEKSKAPLSLNLRRASKTQNLLDKWILSKLNGLILDVSEKLDKYDITSSARNIESFVINDLSLWYIRRSRQRFQNPRTKKEKLEASQTLSFVLLFLSKLTALFTPFLSEEIYQRITNKKSVHLENWPKADKKIIDRKLEEKMEKVRAIVAKALSQRAKAGIKVRQPLSKLQITEYKLQKDKELLDLIKEEINVKEITFGRTIKLDTKITLKLKEEGIIREFLRYVQDMRKKAKFKPTDKILIQYVAQNELNDIINRNSQMILEKAKVKKLNCGKKPKLVFDIQKEVKIDNQNLWLAIKKV